MKKTIIAIVFALFSIALNAKEVATSGNLTLNEDGGIYSITGKLGIVPLGNLQEASKTLLLMDKSFTEKKLSIGNPDFKVMEDEDGLYIIKIGLGGVKIRPADATKFGAILCGKEVGNGISNGIKALKKEFKELTK